MLIVVGTVVVVVMVFAGFSVYSNYMEQAGRDQLIATAHDLAVNAQIYYKKPREFGGGGGSFVGWTIPASLDNEDIGKLKTNVKTDQINLSITGIYDGIDGSSEMKITAVINTDGLSIRIKN